MKSATTRIVSAILAQAHLLVLTPLPYKSAEPFNSPTLASSLEREALSATHIEFKKLLPHQPLLGSLLKSTAWLIIGPAVGIGSGSGAWIPRDNKSKDEKRWSAAVHFFQVGEQAYKKKQWAKSVSLLRDAINQLRPLASRVRFERAEEARTLLIKASEWEHIAGIQVAERERLKSVIDQIQHVSQLKYSKKVQLIIQERAISATGIISVQAEALTDRGTVEYRKRELEQGLPIRAIVIHSEVRNGETRGRYFALDGHHRARAAYELGEPLNSFVITAPEDVVQGFAKTAWETFGEYRTIPNMNFSDAIVEVVPLTVAIEELARELGNYDKGIRTAMPLLAGFEQRGRFITWEDIRDYMPLLRKEAKRRPSRIQVHRLPEGRLRLTYKGPSTGVHLERGVPWILSRPIRDAILVDAARDSKKRFIDRDVEILETEKIRVTGDALLVHVKGTTLFYRLKPTHSLQPEIEIERLSIASLLHLGPRVIYAEVLRAADQMSWRTGLIVREFYLQSQNVTERGRRLTRIEAGAVGRQLAEKIFLMFDIRRGHRIIHPFDNLVSNIFFIGKGPHLKVRFTDWRPLTPIEQLVSDQEWIRQHFRNLIPLFESYLPPLVAAQMLFRLESVARRANHGTWEFFEVAWGDVRTQLEEGSSIYRHFYKITDEVLKTLRDNPHPAVFPSHRVWVYPDMRPLMHVAMSRKRTSRLAA